MGFNQPFEAFSVDGACREQIRVSTAVSTVAVSPVLQCPQKNRDLGLFNRTGSTPAPVFSLQDIL